MADLLYVPIQLQSQPVVCSNYIVINCDFSAMGHSSGQGRQAKPGQNITSYKLIV